MGVNESYRGASGASWGPKGFTFVLSALLITSFIVPAVLAARPDGPTRSSILTREPLEIQSVDLRQGTPGLFLDVVADGPVIWTSFRDAEGRLIVELPNARPASQLQGLYPADGLVEAVGVESDMRANRPVTRLRISTRAPVEHSLLASGSRLEVSLVPTGAPAPARTRAPLPREEHGAGAAAPPTPAPSPLREAPPEPAYQEEDLPVTEESDTSVGYTEVYAEESLAEPPAREEPVRLAALDPTPTPDPQPPEADEDPDMTGTAENPVVAPPPAGVSATRLEGVEVMSTGDGTVLKIEGDGEFDYSFFSLDSPARFVVDLEGVVNEARQGALEVGSDVVTRVRLAQFKPYPDPVSRVVFDLSRQSVPRIERTDDGLVLRFNGAADRTAGAVPAEPARNGGAPAEPSMADSAMDEPAMEPSMDEPAMDEPARADDTRAEDTRAEDTRAEDTRAEDTRADDTRADDAMDTVDMDTVEIADEPPAAAGDRIQVEPAETPREPAPRIAAPPTSGELEVYDNEQRQEEQAEDRPSPRIRRERPTPAAAVPSGGDFAVRTIEGAESRYVGEPMDLKVRDADVVEVLRMFAQISGLNMVVQPGVAGTVTVELTNVPWDQALEQILKINGLGFQLEGNIMRVAPISQLREEAEEQQRLEQARALSVPLNTMVKRLSYANAQSVAGLLSRQGGVLSQRGSVIVDQRTNTMIIKELPDFMDSVISIIELLDTPEPQVMIEARIVETTKRFSRSLGISWNFLADAQPELGNTTGLEFPNNVNATGGVNLLTGGDNGFIDLSLGNVLNSFVLNAQLQAAETEGLINILSAPKVATLNNEQASIQSGLQIPVQTVANNTVTVQFVNATLELRVTPQVTAEGTILMDIDISKREPQLAFAVQGASNAPISTKEASTRVIVRDGGTTVIGGIYEVSTDQGEDRVPGLANIPIIGHLFRNKRRSDENEELLIFITPRVINL